MSNIINSYRFVTAAGGYLLDTYTNAKAAYSLRKLKTGVTHCVELRRDSDGATTDLEVETSGSITLSTNVSAGGSLSTWGSSTNVRVKQWYDQSGNSLDHINTDWLTMPRLTNNGTLETDGGLAAANFLTNKRLDYSGTTGDFGSTGAQARTTFIVNSSVSASNKTIFGIGNTTTSGSGNLYDITEEYGIRVNGGNEIYDAGSSVQNLAVCLFPTSSTNVTESRFFKDGTELGVSSSVSQTINTVDSHGTIGGSTYASSANHNGKIQEIIFFATDESSNRGSIESDINTHYSIY